MQIPEVRTLGLALAIELLIGDPQSRWHPVALFGRWIAYTMQLAPRSGRVQQLGFGAALVASGVGGVALGGHIVLRSLEVRSPVAAWLLAGVLLKCSFSYRQLEHEAHRVARLLGRDEISGARHALHALVGRDTRSLSAPLVAAAVVESVAENLSDSWVAPLLAYLAFGVPGALAYRAINTFDAMLGYHGQYEYLGRAAARLDDLANLLPARLTALLIVASAGFAGGHPTSALRTALCEHGRTESPNAGWPMAAMAGALRVRLEKVSHYVLGESFRECDPSTIERSLRIARVVAGTAVGAATVLAWWRSNGSSRRP